MCGISKVHRLIGKLIVKKFLKFLFENMFFWEKKIQNGDFYSDVNMYLLVAPAAEQSDLSSDCSVCLVGWLVGCLFVCRQRTCYKYCH